jgi:hypothetical protein
MQPNTGSGGGARAGRPDRRLEGADVYKPEGLTIHDRTIQHRLKDERKWVFGDRIGEKKPVGSEER